MGNASVDSQMIGENKEDSVCSSGNGSKLEDVSTLDVAKSKIHSSVDGRKPRRLILNFNQSVAHEILGQELFIRSWLCLGSRIPKLLLSADENYLRRCLALMLISASKATILTPCSVSMCSADLGLSLDHLYPPETLGSSVDIAKLDADNATTVGSESMITSSAARWIVGSVMRSDSMVSLLKSSFFVKLGNFDNGLNFDKPSTVDTERCELSTSLFHEPEKKSLAVSRQVHTSYTRGRTPSSVTNTMAVASDQFTASSSSSPFNCQGILRISWNNGVPQFTFSVDGHKELYVAHARKDGSPDNKSSDFVYLFHRKPDILKEYDPQDSTLNPVVGVMRVSTSVSLCPNNKRVRETEFVLFSLQDDHTVGPTKVIQSDKRTRKLSRVTELLKGVPLKRSDPLKSISGNMSLNKIQDAYGSFQRYDKTNFPENHLPPNLELVAVVVKDHLPDDDVHEKEEVGGWGLKFLGKGRAQRGPSSSEASPSLEKHAGDCFMCMDVIVPAGIHGGPRTRNNGPSSLIERWKSGGQCDCGGWDVGCSLKLLHLRPTKEEGSLYSETQAEPKLFTIFAKGSEEGIPWLRMVNMHDGLYDIGFQSTLSALQCFSIAVAVIHSRSPSLRPKNV